MRDYGQEEMWKGCRVCRPGRPCWRHLPGIVQISRDEIEDRRRMGEETAAEKDILDTPTGEYP